MSPTGFGSVPCEKLENPARWRAPAAGGLAGQPPARHVAGQLRWRERSWHRSAQRAPRVVVAPLRRAADSRGRKRSSAAAAARRCVRVSRPPPARTWSGPRSRRRTSRRCSTLESTLHARHGADRTDAGFHVLPACRNVAHRRPFNRCAGERVAISRPDFSRVIRRPLTRKRHARAELPQPLQRAPSGVRLPLRRPGADAVLPGRAGRQGTSITASRWCWRGSSPTRASSTGRNEPPTAKANQPYRHQRSRSSRRGCRSSSGAAVPDDD